MKLKVEKWSESHKPFCRESESLFNEGILCYKLGAYKAAFILSYLAFKVVLKNRILECPYIKEIEFRNPKFFTNELKPKLLNEDTWEREINNVINCSTKNESEKKDSGRLFLFTYPDKIMLDYEYWKSKRNSCVHNKSDSINSSTIEEFWNFLIDNLSQFHILGNKEHTLLKLVKFYELSHHNILEEDEEHALKALLSEFKLSNKNDEEKNEFFDTFFKNIKQVNYSIINNENKNYWDNYFNRNDLFFKELCSYIIKDKQLFFIFCKYYPKLYEYAKDLDKEFVTKKLFGWLKQKPDQCINSDMKVYWELFIKLTKDSGEFNIDIKEIIDEEFLLILNTLPVEQEDIFLLNKYNIFDYVLENSSWFYQTGANSQYGNWLKISGKEADNIILCYKLLDWNDKVLNKLENTIGEFKTSEAGRINSNSIKNATTYKQKLKKILCVNKEEIESITNNNFDEYFNIREWLQEC